MKKKYNVLIPLPSLIKKIVRSFSLSYTCIHALPFLAVLNALKRHSPVRRAGLLFFVVVVVRHNPVAFFLSAYAGLYVTISNLLPATQYLVRVRYVSTVGASVFTDAVQFTTASDGTSFPYGLLYRGSLWTIVRRFLMDRCILVPYDCCTSFLYGLLYFGSLWTVVPRFLTDSCTSVPYGLLYRGSLRTTVLLFLMDCCTSVPYGLLYVGSLWTVLCRFLIDRCKLFPNGPLHVVSLWTVVSCFLTDRCTSFLYGLL